jgi:proteasome alpha subunit
VSQPFYVSPEQLMKDRADFARKGVARGRAVVVVAHAEGISFAGENPSRALHKVSEIYDRIAFAAVGKYNEFENLRVAGVRYADLRGYSYDRSDVTARGLANAYAQTLGAVFTEQSKPYEVELVVAEVGASPAEDQLYRLTYDGSVVEEHGFVAMGAGAEQITTNLRENWTAELDGAAALRPGRRRAGRRAAAGRRDAGDRGRVAGGRHPGPRPAPACLPPPRRRGGAGGPAGRLIAAAGRPGASWGSDEPVAYRSGMDRRILGLETEYGVTCAFEGTRRLSPDEVARYLFRKVVSWGRSSNVFLRTAPGCTWTSARTPSTRPPSATTSAPSWSTTGRGSGSSKASPPTPRRGCARRASPARCTCSRTTPTRRELYGCHENYLVSRHGEFSRLSDTLIPFLVSRQLVAGAGKVTHTPRGALYSLSQRADHIWEGVSSATTRSRPIINTRDEPHADAEHFRRLHVIVGDSSMSEATTLLKVGATDLVLRMVEAATPSGT